MEWSRSLRIEAPPEDAVRSRVAAALAQEGVRIRMAGCADPARTYVLLEGPEGVDPAQVEARYPQARWFGEAVIALAIEPAPPDALPMLEEALGGSGAPAGIAACERHGRRLILEICPSVTPVTLVLQIADVELRRFGGGRRTQLLSPLSGAVAAAVAAGGLQAAQIGPERILELLLERADVG